MPIYSAGQSEQIMRFMVKVTMTHGETILDLLV